MMHKNVGYMIKCKENSLYSPEFITKWYKPITSVVKKEFLNKNVKLKRFFTKWPVFPSKLCALHRTAGQNVGNASLAKRG